MALSFGDEGQWKGCSCGCELFTEHPIYKYKKEKGLLKSYLVSVVVKCNSCKKTLTTIDNNNNILVEDAGEGRARVRYKLI